MHAFLYGYWEKKTSENCATIRNWPEWTRVWAILFWPHSFWLKDKNKKIQPFQQKAKKKRISTRKKQQGAVHQRCQNLMVQIYHGILFIWLQLPDNILYLNIKGDGYFLSTILILARKFTWLTSLHFFVRFILC